MGEAIIWCDLELCSYTYMYMPLVYRSCEQRIIASGRLSGADARRKLSTLHFDDGAALSLFYRLFTRGKSLLWRPETNAAELAIVHLVLVAHAAPVPVCIVSVQNGGRVSCSRSIDTPSLHGRF